MNLYLYVIFVLWVLISLLVARGVVGTVSKRAARHKSENNALREMVSSLYRYASEDEPLPPLRGREERQALAETLFSFVRHVAVLTPSALANLSATHSLAYYLMLRAEGGRAEEVAEALQLLSVLPLSDEYAERVRRLSPVDPHARFYRLLILLCHTPSAALLLLEAEGERLPLWFASRLSARMEEARIPMPRHDYLHSLAPLPPLVALATIGRYGLVDAEAEVREVVGSSNVEVRCAALATLARLGAGVGGRGVVEAVEAMPIGERRRVMRIFMREGYSSEALSVLSEAERERGGVLGDYVEARLSSRKRALNKVMQ